MLGLALARVDLFAAWAPLFHSGLRFSHHHRVGYWYTPLTIFFLEKYPSMTWSEAMTHLEPYLEPISLGLYLDPIVKWAQN